MANGNEFLTARLSGTIQRVERRFTEQQVSEIISRAAEVQQGSSLHVARNWVGVSEPELRRIAGELGIASGAIDRAISEFSVLSADEPPRGSNVEHVLSRRINREVDDEEIALIAEALPRSLIDKSELHLGRTIQYRTAIKNCACTVTISRKGGRTVIRVKFSDSSLNELKVLLYVPAVMSAIVGVFALVLGEVGVGMVFLLILPMILVMAAMSSWEPVRRRLLEGVRTTLDDLVKTLGDGDRS